MDRVDVRIIFLGWILCSIIFFLDWLFSLGAISILYIFFMLMTFWQSDKVYHINGSIVISILLTYVGWLIQTRTTEIEIIVNPFHFVMNYEGLFRVVTVFILVFLGSVLVRQKNKEFELSKLNESLELRILARTAASEARAARLEKQIYALQSLRSYQVESSIKKLDDVINELKQLNEMESND